MHNSFAEELKELVEKWDGFIGTTREEIIVDLQEAIDRLDGEDIEDAA